MKKIFENKKVLIGLMILAIVAVGFGIYNSIPKHNVFVKGPSMHYPHSEAVMLQDGRVLVLGGKHPEAEIYDPKTNKFSIIGKTKFIRNGGFTATLLKNGKVLIAGGSITRDVSKRSDLVTFKSEVVGSAEIYDPKTNKFSIVYNNMKVPREGHTATLLPNGQVLIIGGHAENKFALEIEEFDPGTNVFKIVSKMDSPNFSHKSLLLPNNKVLIVGEPDNNKNEFFLTIYDPYKNKVTNKIKIKDSFRSGTVTLLNDNRVLITGGDGFGGDNLKYTIIYDIKKGKVIDSSDLNIGRGHHTATLLFNGKVLIIGGQTGQTIFERAIKSAELYNQNTDKFEELSAKLALFRSGQKAIPLNNGNVIIIGGSNRKGAIVQSEFYLY